MGCKIKYEYPDYLVILFVITKSIVVASNIVYWFEKKGRCNKK